MAVPMQSLMEKLRNAGRENLAEKLRFGGPMDPRLYEAARSGDRDLLRQQVKENREMLCGVTPLRDTAMHVAMRHENIDFAKDLCEFHPAMLMQQNSKEGTPLHYALKTGKDSFFEEGARAVSSHPDLQGFWDLVQEWPTEMEGILVNPKGESLLYLAAEVGYLNAVKTLLGTPLASHANGPKGLNALYAAIAGSHYDDTAIVIELLKRFPQLNKQRDDSGNTPLHHAVSLKKYGMVESLVTKDASVADIPNDDGLLPVHVATNMRLVSYFNYLVLKCPDCGLRATKRGMNVLHLSVKAGAMNIVNSILANPRLKGSSY